MIPGAARAAAFVRGASDCFVQLRPPRRLRLPHRRPRPRRRTAAPGCRVRPSRPAVRTATATARRTTTTPVCWPPSWTAWTPPWSPSRPTARSPTGTTKPSRILGWTTAEAVGRAGLAGWAVRKEDADEIDAALSAAMRSPGRQVHEFALLTKDGHRVLVRTQSSAVRGPDGRVAGRVLRLQRGARPDRPGAVHRAQRGTLRGRVLGRGAGRRRPAARRRQRPCRPRPGRGAHGPAGAPAGRPAGAGRRRSWRARCSTSWPRARRRPPPSCG